MAKIEKNLEIIKTYRTYPHIEKKIEHIVEKNPEIYNNHSHFIRVAIAKLMREHAGGML